MTTNNKCCRNNTAKKKKFFSFLRYLRLYKFALIGIHTGICVILAIITHPFRYTPWPLDYYALWWWGVGARWIFSVEVIKLHTKKPEDGKMYLAPHFTYWDILIAGSCLRGFFLAKSAVKKWPMVGAGAYFIRTIFIDREKAKRALEVMKEKVLEVCNNNSAVIIFPEGTRSYNHMNTFKAGTFRVAKETGLKIVPTVLLYAPKDNAYFTGENFLSHVWNKLCLDNYKFKCYLHMMDEIDPADYSDASTLRAKCFEVMDNEYKRLDALHNGTKTEETCSKTNCCSKNNKETETTAQI